MLYSVRMSAGVTDLKESVRQYWEQEPCNTRYADQSDRLRFFKELEHARYQYEPNILELAQFDQAKGLQVLEIGVGAGIDFCNWVRNGAIATGIDLTEHGLQLTKEHLDLEGFSPSTYKLMTADAENLPFAEGSFDVVYSYGVLHHSPDTATAFKNAFRVLKPGGKFKAMIYHSPSWCALNLWLYYALLRLKPWKSFKRVIFENLESPGTKVYTVKEARALTLSAGFTDCKIKLFLDAGDRMNLKLGPKYENNRLVKLAQKLYPSRLIELLDSKARLGTTMHIEAVK